MGVRAAGQEATQGCPGSGFFLPHPKPSVLVKGCLEGYKLLGISLVRAQWPVRAQSSPPNYSCRCWRLKYTKTWGHKNGKEGSGRSEGSPDTIYCTIETVSVKFGSDWQLLSSGESRFQRHFPVA